MNLRLFLLIHCAVTLCVTTLAPTAWADTVYDNGSKNGTYTGWEIGKGSSAITTDSFTLTGEDKALTGLSFAAWITPGDTVTSVEVDITSQPFGGITYFDQIIAVTRSQCGFNGLGFLVCVESGSFAGPILSARTYWLSLTNAITNNGYPVGWDENKGEGCSSPGCPSIAMNNSQGTIPSEAFTVFGTINSETSPEPGSLVLFGTGVAGLIAAFRGKPS